jgi:hypothetical protein
LCLEHRIKEEPHIKQKQEASEEDVDHLILGAARCDKQPNADVDYSQENRTTPKQDVLPMLTHDILLKGLIDTKMTVSVSCITHYYYTIF